MEAKKKKKEKRNVLRQVLEEEMQMTNAFIRKCPAPRVVNNKINHEVISDYKVTKE